MRLKRLKILLLLLPGLGLIAVQAQHVMNVKRTALRHLF